MSFDLQLFYALNNLAGKSPTLDRFFVFLASDMAYLILGVFVVLLFFSKYENREKIRMFIIALVSALIARGIITELIRYFYHRPRPFMVLDTHQLLIDNAWSFPSGHATFFFALATALYFYNKKWGSGFFIATLLITTSRVIAGVHYPSDILGGMLIGIITALVVYRFAQRKKDTEVSVSPRTYFTRNS